VSAEANVTGGRDPRLAVVGIFLVVCAAPLMIFPASTAPYADIKQLVVAGGAALLFFSTTDVDRRLAAAVALWVATLVAASATGVDPLMSTFGTPDGNGVGLITILSCGVLIVCGTAVHGAVRQRVPVWLLNTACVVAAVAVVEKVLAAGAVQELGGSGSLLGQPVLTGALLGTALVAAGGIRPTASWAARLALVSTGLSFTGNRTGWIAAAAGFAILFATSRQRRPVVVAGAVIVTTATCWILVERAAAPAEGHTRLSPAARLAEVEYGSSARQRLYYWSGSLKALAARPLLGWGPGNTGGAFLTSASVTDLRGARTSCIDRSGASGGPSGASLATFTLDDPHNIFVASAVTGGVVGLVTFCVVLGLVAARSTRSRERAWEVPVACALLIPHLLQPQSVILTPLWFLFLGFVATGRGPVRTPPRWSWLGAVCVLVVGLASARMTASVLESYARTYGSPRALALAATIEPGRVSALDALALDRALDGRSGVPGAADEARETVRTAVAQHPWHPSVRLTASNVEILLKNPSAARTWTHRHLERFPYDPRALAGAARLAEESGEPVPTADFRNRIDRGHLHLKEACT